MRHSIYRALALGTLVCSHVAYAQIQPKLSPENACGQFTIAMRSGHIELKPNEKADLGGAQHYHSSTRSSYYVRLENGTLSEHDFYGRIVYKGLYVVNLDAGDSFSIMTNPISRCSVSIGKSADHIIKINATYTSEGTGDRGGSPVVAYYRLSEGRYEELPDLDKAMPDSF